MAYRFIADWQSHHIPTWKKHLDPLAGKQDLNFLEIGSFEGRSAIWFLENVLTHSSSRLTCVDPFAGVITLEELDGADFPLSTACERFIHNINETGQAHQVTTLKGFSHDILPHLPVGSFDVVYVDGSHIAPDVLEDAVLSFRLLKQGGLLILDDYGEYDEGDTRWDRPKMAIDAFLDVYLGRYVLLEQGAQVILCRNDARWRRHAGLYKGQYEVEESVRRWFHA